MSTQTAANPSAEAQPRAGATARIALAAALVGAMLTWTTMFAGPLLAQVAEARGDYGNIFTAMYIGWGLVITLDLAAVILGARGIRQRTDKALSGAAIGIGGTGFIGVLVYLLLTFQVMPLVSPYIY